MEVYKGKLIYFADAMCSWCYAFDDEMEKLKEQFNNILEFEIVPGGLHPYEERKTTKDTSISILSHWYDVKEVTKKEFDLEFFNKNEGFIYDTAPSSRAINAVKIIDSSQTLNFLKELQKLFYYDGFDPTKLETFIYALRVTNIEVETFEEIYNSNEISQETDNGFKFARSFGISSFPTLILEYNSKSYLISQGYSKCEEIAQRIIRIIND